MEPCLFRTAGHSGALHFAASELKNCGWIENDYAKHILLPVPSFNPDGTIKGGQDSEEILTDDAIIWGGNFPSNIAKQYRCIDLLQDPFYLAKNAAITAHCTIKHLMNNLPVTLANCPVLILGWGRIGKCLADILSKLGAQVTVYARKSSDQAMAYALGYETIRSLVKSYSCEKYRVIINTAPELLLAENQLSPKQLKIDLASKPGISAPDVIWARGLPAKDAPESSGKLIAETILRLRKELIL